MSENQNNIFKQFIDEFIDNLKSQIIEAENARIESDTKSYEENIDDLTTQANDVTVMSLLTQRIEELFEEQENLKKLYVQINVDISSLQTIIRTLATNQAQIVADLQTIYSHVKELSDNANRENEENNNDKSIQSLLARWRSDDDDDSGGMLN